MLWTYTRNLLVALDQLLNVLFGGDPDETVSSRLGRVQRRHGGRIPTRRPVSKVLQKTLDTIDRGHCRKSIEHDEGGNGIVDKP